METPLTKEDISKAIEIIENKGDSKKTKEKHFYPANPKVKALLLKDKSLTLAKAKEMLSQNLEFSVRVALEELVSEKKLK